jgi:hypothetical protein
MLNRASVAVTLLAIIAVLLGVLLLARVSPAQAVSEGQTDKVIAIASTFGGDRVGGGDSILYIIDTTREVILIYGLSSPGQTVTRDLRNASFEFLAGRLYRWDLLLSSKAEYSIRGVRTLRGLRVHGAGSSQEEYQRLDKSGE